MESSKGSKGKAAAASGRTKRKRSDEDDEGGNKKTARKKPSSKEKADRKSIDADEEEDEEEDEDAPASKKRKVEVLLAVKWDLEKGPDPTGWWVSEKLDGVRYVLSYPRGVVAGLMYIFSVFWDGKCMFSRLGNPFTPPKWLTDSEFRLSTAFNYFSLKTSYS